MCEWIEGSDGLWEEREGQCQLDYSTCRTTWQLGPFHLGGRVRMHLTRPLP